MSSTATLTSILKFEDQEIDYSLPLSALIRASTAARHATAQTISPGAGWLLRGELDPAEYARYLVMIHALYSTLEDLLDEHKDNAVLAACYNPTVLSRKAALEADINHLLSLPSFHTADATLTPATWKSHPHPPALTTYLDRLHFLAKSEPHTLLAHSYIRYLGDLSGGQIIRRRIQKAYALGGTPGDDSDESLYGETVPGLTFYEFPAQTEGQIAGMTEMKRIKENFRQGMDRAGDVYKDADAMKRVKADIIAEAHLAFQMHNGLFDTLAAPSEAPAKDKSPLLAPSTGRVVAEFPPPAAAATERTVSLATLVAVVAAACLAHFGLTLAGITSARGTKEVLERLVGVSSA
ncbi:hypothetical protein PLICRDRAFT_39195 [Plicaturopsis crispa FD-325 SS-3]|nr:hypothetical protein PLICRDRAFT_39195 [Plicaturopsis crispa FD-325 SS-3]